jgi:hypothetical protein
MFRANPIEFVDWDNIGWVYVRVFLAKILIGTGLRVS